jgi:AraC-like DNA-binding protein
MFYDSRDPLGCDLLHNWNDLNLQLSEQFVRKWVPRPAVLTRRNICRDSKWGRLLARLFDRLTTAEIGRRAGFSDASHFVKVLRSRTGQTPLRIRRGAQ